MWTEMSYNRYDNVSCFNRLRRETQSNTYSCDISEDEINLLLKEFNIVDDKDNGYKGKIYTTLEFPLLVE